MAANQKTIYVYDDFSAGRPILMGRLFVNAIRGGEVYSFAYDGEWLEKTGSTISLDPELLPYSGRQYPSGKFSDCLPMRLRTAGDGSS